MAVASKKLYFLNKTRGQVLAREAKVADSFFNRLVGLLKTEVFEKGASPFDGLLIVPCNQIHMFGMKYPIDCVFMDKTGIVVGLCKSIQPGKMSSIFARAHQCLELPAGIVSDTGTCVGDLIESGEPVALS